jgi:phage-related minor tail protein
MTYRQTHPELFNHEDPKTTNAILDSKLSRVKEIIVNCNKTAKDLKDSLREYEAYADTSIEDELERATRELAAQQAALSGATSNSQSLLNRMTQRDIEGQRQQGMNELSSTLGQRADQAAGQHRHGSGH